MHEMAKCVLAVVVVFSIVIAHYVTLSLMTGLTLRQLLTGAL